MVVANIVRKYLGPTQFLLSHSGQLVCFSRRVLASSLRLSFSVSVSVILACSWSK